MTPSQAYYKASSSGYTRELEILACKDPFYSYCFACDVPGADIEYCQEWACKDPEHAYWFACHVAEADINYCLETCKGTGWYAKIKVHIMEEALG